MTVPGAFQVAIFDVEGVLIDSPHAQAWQEALPGLTGGKWRDVRAPTSDTPRRFSAFPDALRFILAVKSAGIPVAAAAPSQDAKLFLQQIRLDTFAAEQRLHYPFLHAGMTLLGLFDADISGQNAGAGKPDADILSTAADELGVSPGQCFVVADEAVRIQAARAAGMSAIGVARRGGGEQLSRAGAHLVVTALDDISIAALAEGRLERRSSAAELQRRQQEHPPSAWSLVYQGFEPENQGLRETLCALGNGYVVTRGALPEARADEIHYPGTYVAGLYNRLQTPVAGRMIENEDLVNVPNWLPLSFRAAGGAWFDVQDEGVLDHQLELDLRRGVLIRKMRWKDAAGRVTSMVQRRLVSMKDPHLAALETEFTAENWTGTLEVWSGLDGRVVNCGVRRYRDLNGRHLSVLHAAEAGHETIELQAETSQSHVRVALAARTRAVAGGGPVTPGRRLVTEPGFVAHALMLELEQHHPVTVEKVAALFTSRDRAISESLLSARLAAQTAPGFGGLEARHAAAWETLWNRFDVEIDSVNKWVESVLHLHVFHLLQTVSPHSAILDAGVPARGWHGEAYRGHVFWDEMFVFPFLNLQRPWLASALLDYRRERLGAARAA
ncbi:MAG TPA: HAD-IA family hydrolase, partial [Streptosporangiaceae bacterium]|nr:HAD-IA family hydrolase [Streptosporangiaceae bacterium]